LNEASTIVEVVVAVRRHVPTVFIVDDGSSDETSALAKRAGAEVLRHGSPRGKGAALQTGWERARVRGFEWALALDGDGQHSAEDIPAFLDTAVQSGAELIVGNRMSNPEGMPWFRKGVNRWMSKRISKLAGIELPDSQCGFRLMSLNAWSKLAVAAAHFEVESDVLLAFAAGEYSIQFVPIQVIYKAEQSKIHPIRDTIRWFRWWSRARRQICETRVAMVGRDMKYSACAAAGKSVSAVRVHD
jgi:glycosyltransferase involved in cell wall biosynthesis